jgi:EAL domain-containing protein (putative c-di-GMP-specific phosphodiesterase class I)/ActR/RegA family two-component response regulator
MSGEDSKILKHSYLIVDDEAFMRTLIGRILKGIGAENVAASQDGQSALDHLDGNHADVVLCDLNMPGMDGIEFLRHLTKTDFNGAIVLISGEDPRVLDTARNLAEAHDLVVLGALSKPVKPGDLKALLDKLEVSLQGQHAYGQIDELSVDELRAGIGGDELELFYQPKVSVKDKRVIGVESLVRWRHRERGLVPPVAFISVAEKNGLIDALTDAIYAKAVQQGGTWLAEGLDIKMSVNISVDSLNRLDLPEFIVDMAAEGGLDPSHIILEITESQLMADIKSPLEILTRLRLKGVSLSIDDFGTGHSSMEQLKRIPFTELKVDRAFVYGASKDPAARAILESSVSLAKSLGMSTVAEGVEDQEDWDLVASIDVDMVQGYFVAKPMPADEFNAWLAAWPTS